MRFRLGPALALISVAVLVGLACTSNNYDDACTTFGGACQTNPNACGEALPYPCTVGTCCITNPMGLSDGSTPITPLSSPDTGAPPTGVDASAGRDVGVPPLPDAHATSPDTGSPGQDASQPVDAAADQGSAPPPDAGHDSGGSDDAGHDAGQDAGHDSGHDAGHDAGSGGEAGPGCLDYAAPNTLGLCTGCLDAVPQVSPCQNNGCFGGYYCHTTSLSCVKPTNVHCDAG